MPDSPVPPVVGLTRVAAETALRSAGFTVGTVTRAESHTVPAGGVSSTTPPAGTSLTHSSPVHLEVSGGQKTALSQYIPTVIVTIIGLVILATVLMGIGHSGFLVGLADPEVARGLITFLIAFVTVGIALILVLSTILLTENAEADKRFDRGKQVLTSLIGVLGTIVGFYFASAIATKTAQETLKLIMTPIHDGFVNTVYPTQTIQASGGTPPLRWYVAPALPAGLSLNVETGAISGTPTTVSPKNKYTVIVADSAKPSVASSGEFTLEVKPQTAPLRIPATSLPDGTTNTVYQMQNIQVSGGTRPLKWSIAPSLPAGLVLNPESGAITGTPTMASPKAKYTITVTDSSQPAVSSTGEVTLEIK